MKVIRSNTRRNAVIIPLKKGQELASLAKDEMDKEKKKNTDNNDLKYAWSLLIYIKININHFIVK